MICKAGISKLIQGPSQVATVELLSKLHSHLRSNTTSSSGYLIFCSCMVSKFPQSLLTSTLLHKATSPHSISKLASQ